MSSRTHLAKVPEVTALFWVAKLITTAFGEAASDFLANTFNPYIVVPLSGLVLLGSLWTQFRARKYIPALYWSTVAMVAVFGTMIADVLHKQFGVSYGTSTVVFLIALTFIFLLWYGVEKSLSIHTITSPRRELFYWATVMTTFALGTAAGDWTADTLRLGYFDSGLLFAAIIAIPLIGYTQLGLGPIIGFWFAYIVTRPLGASFADWFGKPAVMTGIGLGDGIVAAILLILLIGVVWFMATNREEYRNETQVIR